MKFRLFIILLFVSGSIHAGSRNDSLAVNQEIRLAQELINTGNYDSAEYLLDHSSGIARDQQLWYLYFISQTTTASLFEKKGDLNDVVRIYIEMIRLLEKNQHYELMARSYAELGREYIEYELYKKAIGYFLLSKEYFEKSDNIIEKVDALSRLGRLYLHTESYGEAEKSLIEAINLMKNHYPGKDITGLLTELVEVYEKKGDIKKMLEINLQLFEIAKNNSDLLAIAVSLNNLGYNYATLGDHEQALKYFQNAYHTNNLLNQPARKKAAGLTNIGITFENLGRDQIAIDTLRSALKIWERENDHQRITELNTVIARIYLQTGEPDAAEVYADAALKSAEISNDLEALRKCYETYSMIFQDTDDFEQALFYHKKYLQLDDSLRNLAIARERLLNQREFDAERAEKELSLILADRELKDLMMRQMQLENESNQKEIALLKSSQELQELEKERALQRLKLTRQALDAEKKDREIEYLQQQQELQRLALAGKEAEELEQEKTIQLLEQQSQLREEQLERTILKRRLAILTIGLLIIILILIIIGYFQKRKDNKLLSEQKESIMKINQELEDKNKKIAIQRDEITSSFTELEHTVEELKKTQNQLLEAEKMASIGQLTAGIAHEINNPINFVSSNVSPLRMNLTELKEILEAYRSATSNGVIQEGIETARDLENKYDLEYLIREVDLLLDGISEGASRTKEIVQGLRNFSRVDEHELRTASVHDGLDSTLLLLNNLMKNRIEVEKIYDENLPSIECFPGQLNQVFMNILNNAVQAIEGKGRITIKTKKLRNRAVIWITDTGKGIPKEYMNRIFDPFFTTKEVGEGTGLGLSISYGIIQQHKGEIRVTSKPGKGTTFKISIPLRHT